MKTNTKHHGADSLANLASPETLLTRREVASRFRVSVQTIARWERNGLIRGRRINQRVVRYRASDVEKLVA